MKNPLLALLLLISCAASLSAQDQKGSFDLTLKDKSIGTAEYSITPAKSGHAIKSNFRYKIESTDVSMATTATFDAGWEIIRSNMNAFVAGEPENMLIAPNKQHTQLQFANVTDLAHEMSKSFDMGPHTVSLPNFDPGAIQILINMAVSNPAPDGSYHAFIPQSIGAMLTATFKPDAAQAGTLDGKDIALKCWTLMLGSVQMSVCADTSNNLMQAAVASQQVAYTRKGFVLKPIPASATPSVSASPATPSAATPPASSAPKNFVERDISFMSDGITFHGTLCLPAENAKNLPIVVMAQGSGVQDRNETVGPNKVFEQLAHDLAQRGVATIRYDRRAIADRASLMAHLDPEHEVVIDAAAALAFAATVPEANPHRVFMLGHSLGAELAPYIVARRLQQQPGSVRGMIMLAANGLSIDKVIERQVESQAKQSGMTADQIAALHKQWEDQFALARNPATPASQPIGIAPIMVPASYWRDWLNRDPAVEMRAHPIATLVIRGGNDWNITHDDFEIIAAAATAPGSKSVELPGLNHIFMPSTDANSSASEFQPGIIAPILPDTIAAWIQSLN